MARKRLIATEQLLDFLDQYLIEQCSRNPNLLVISKFGDFVRKNGYPDVKDTTIRRNELFREKLEEYRVNFEDEGFQAVITYKTLDAENFILRNRTPGAMKNALTELSQYYKKIADLAISYKKEADELRERFTELEAEVESLKGSEVYNKQLTGENKRLRNIINTTVYPEIANELLKAEGLLKSDHQVISDSYLKENILTADSVIDFHSESNPKPDSESKPEKKKVVSIRNILDSKTNY